MAQDVAGPPGQNAGVAGQTAQVFLAAPEAAAGAGGGGGQRGEGGGHRIGHREVAFLEEFARHLGRDVQGAAGPVEMAPLEALQFAGAQSQPAAEEQEGQEPGSRAARDGEQGDYHW